MCMNFVSTLDQSMKTGEIRNLVALILLVI